MSFAGRCCVEITKLFTLKKKQNRWFSLLFWSQKSTVQHCVFQKKYLKTCFFYLFLAIFSTPQLFLKPSKMISSGLQDVKNRIRHHFLTPGNRFPARSAPKTFILIRFRCFSQFSSDGLLPQAPFLIKKISMEKIYFFARVCSPPYRIVTNFYTINKISITFSQKPSVYMAEPWISIFSLMPSL